MGRGRVGPNSGAPKDSASFTCARCGQHQARSEFTFRANGNPRACRSCRKAEYDANREVLIAKSLAWAKANPEAARARSKAHYVAHRDERLAYAVAYAKTWRPAHPEYGKEASARRRRRLASVQRLPYDSALLLARWTYYLGCCWMCGRPADQWDHVKPIFHGGPDMLSNLRPSCDPCNSSKGRS